MSELKMRPYICHALIANLNITSLKEVRSLVESDYAGIKLNMLSRKSRAYIREKLAEYDRTHEG